MENKHKYHGHWKLEYNVNKKISSTSEAQQTNPSPALYMKQMYETALRKNYYYFVTFCIFAALS